MKKIYFFISVLLSGLFFMLNSQPTIVSTQQTYKNVILEAFTGMHCLNAPHGHRIANQLMLGFSPSVFTIFIHQGPCAEPISGEPDYRTPFGDSLAIQSGLTSYPAGTINRHVFTIPTPMIPGRTAQSYLNWSDCVYQFAGIPSPVNVKINVQLNSLTRNLSILVEVYYTGNAANPTNKLNVALVQDYVKGPQDGSWLNPSQVTSDGKYYHMHMLRTFLTGQWGWTIPQTTAGTFWDTTIVYTVPTAFNNVPVELGNLKVVAFVAEDTQEILQSDWEDVPVILDASILSVSGIPELTCQHKISPFIVLRNLGSDTIFSYTIVYGTKDCFYDTLSVNEMLLPYYAQKIFLNDIPVVNGYNVAFAQILTVNDQEDHRSQNNYAEIKITTYYDQLTLPYNEDFSSTTFPPPDVSIQDITKDGKCWLRSNANGGSAKIPFFEIVEGKKDALYIGMFNLLTFQSPVLTFDLAHKMFDSSKVDKLCVEVTTSCGLSWVIKWYKEDPDLSTTTPSSSPYNDPIPADWRKEYVNLSCYAGQQHVIIRFLAESGYGNNLFIDNINIVEATALPEDAMVEMMMYPNPTSDYLHVLFNQPVKEPVQLRVYNTLGEMVFSDDIPTTYELTVRGWESGLYYAVIVLDNQVIKRSFVVQQ